MSSSWRWQCFGSGVGGSRRWGRGRRRLSPPRCGLCGTVVLWRAAGHSRVPFASLPLHHQQRHSFLLLLCFLFLFVFRCFPLRPPSLLLLPCHRVSRGRRSAGPSLPWPSLPPPSPSHESSNNPAARRARQERVTGGVAVAAAAAAPSTTPHQGHSARAQTAQQQSQHDGGCWCGWCWCGWCWCGQK